ncbi:MAG TPA: hypothetical protein VLW17_00640, partial [Thermoanaerobaculaceae bacterium]|nr:hypothetical protein [Thermoanaerobaculaceae bacterium]
MMRRLVVLLGVLLAARTAAAGLTQQGLKLSGTGAAGAAQQAWSAAVSADGGTAIVGGPADGSSSGAAWVFVRSGGAWAQQGGKLTGADATPAALAGNSVALSADGNTAIVGGPGDDSSTGAAWVFTRSNGVWSQQGAKLVGAGASGAAQQGTSVALSADGNTAIVGGWADGSEVGAAWVFARSGSVWTQQGGKLVGTGAAGASNQGWAVALSADGNSALLGGPLDNAGAGAVWTFGRSGGAWTQQGSKLIGSGAAGGAYQGNAVALSADGSTALVAGPGDASFAGAVWAFTRSGGNWMQQGSKLVGTGATGVAAQGIGLAISSDGNTALVGGSGDSSSAGATWVFVRTGAAWTQQGAKLVGSGAVGAAQQGAAVAIAGDGNTAIVGGYADNSFVGFSTGATWAFTRSGGVWTQQGGKLVGSGAIGAAEQGAAVAVSSDGSTAIVGGPQDDANRGAAWVFTRANGTWSQQGAKLVAAGASRQGEAVAISADGDTALVGAPGGDGGAWVYTRSGGVWSQQGGKLLGDAATGEMQGTAVALSADGNTAVIGGPWDGSGAGAAWVFARSAGAWAQQGPKLSGSGATGKARQGASVAISGDGATVVIGGPMDNSSAGAVWVFTRTGGSWSQQGGKLTGSDLDGGLVDLGWSVALSADGNTALVGGWGDSSATGAAWVFTRTGAAWAQQGSKLVGSGAVGHAQRGQSVALSADGNAALVGGYLDDGGNGAAWVFRRSSGAWAQQGDKLVGSGASGSAQQGTAVALSADGTTAVVGGPADDTDAGAAWLFAAPTTFALWVPVASHGNGLNQSQWRSDLGMLDVGGTTANVQLKFFGSGGVTTNTTYVPAGAQA